MREMTQVRPSLVAVVGPIEAPLFAAWTAHYRRLGIERFHLAFHFPDHVAHQARNELLAECLKLGLKPEIVSTGPWHERTNTELREFLIQVSGTEWNLVADSDEFQVYPGTLNDILAEADAAGRQVVGGLMLDRVADDGALSGWQPATGLDAAFPLGGFFTHQVLHADPRKIVMARRGITIASGNHRAAGFRPQPTPIIVHHFKWRAGVQEDLERRVQLMSSSTWEVQSPAVPTEAQRCLDHLNTHSGRIGVGEPDLRFRAVTMAATPTWWNEEATRLVVDWRPAPTATAEQSGHRPLPDWKRH
jgi:hypothetical protein